MVIAGRIEDAMTMQLQCNDRVVIDLFCTEIALAIIRIQWRLAKLKRLR
jgi:hypothetical protein